ncbi:hypothetical protein OSB04_025596 [Centaurea solstitialis]|uniref:Uncharacterized protein n=1 Tax=Centaurea solstitialis TaxID=347529 RepID=A0AA38SQ03_9ASTR|nr:hypothetical protein OSB04_025596 [Centaurea solstitialis]
MSSAGSGSMTLIWHSTVNHSLTCVKYIANGSLTSFWHDPWVGGGACLKSLFPRLYAAEVNKQVEFKDRWNIQNGCWVGSWEWRAGLMGRASQDFDDLILLLQNTGFLAEGIDRWKWSWSKDGDFSSKELALRIQDCLGNRRH